MSMFGPKPGSWYLYSEIDPRWDATGRCEDLVVTAGMPKECREKLEDLKQKLGDQPEDLEYGVMKD